MENTRHLAVVSPMKQYLMILPYGTHICNHSKIFEFCSTIFKNCTSTKLLVGLVGDLSVQNTLFVDSDFF